MSPVVQHLATSTTPTFALLNPGKLILKYIAMAQYVAFDSSVEVMGQTIISVVNALPTGQETRMAILKRHKIVPQEGVWYKQQSWLDAFKEMATEIGDRTL